MKDTSNIYYLRKDREELHATLETVAELHGQLEELRSENSLLRDDKVEMFARNVITQRDQARAKLAALQAGLDDFFAWVDAASEDMFDARGLLEQIETLRQLAAKGRP